jgi:hypothetical protein
VLLADDIREILAAIRSEYCLFQPIPSKSNLHAPVSYLLTLPPFSEQRVQNDHDNCQQTISIRESIDCADVRQAIEVRKSPAWNCLCSFVTRGGTALPYSDR